MDIVEVLKIVSIVLGVLTGTIIPLVIKLAHVIKKRKEAETIAEKAEADKDMLEVVNQFIESAEGLYKDIDTILKERGGTSGAVKKDSVMTKLQAYAIEQGYSFDAEYWSGKIDDIVALTRQVNAKKN